MIAVLRRLASLAAVLLALSFLIFFLSSLIPGDIVTVMVGTEGASGEQFEALREQYGLDGSFVERYGRWLIGAFTLDLGSSPITGRDVGADLARQFPVSLELTILGLLLSTVIGVPAGIVAARFANRRVDNVIRIALLIAFSIPTFVSGILVVLYGSQYVRVLYTSVYVPLSVDLGQNLRSLAFPVLVISLPLTALTMQMTRAAVADELSADYVRLARAKGMGPSRIYFLHALRNALPPLITMLGYQLGLLIGGLVVVEEIFSLPGLGRGLLNAIGARDYPFVAAGTMTLAAMFVVSNAVADGLQRIANPRLRDAQ